MQEEAKNKLMTAEEAANLLDLKRDYVYGRGVAADRDETHLRDYWRSSAAVCGFRSAWSW